MPWGDPGMAFNVSQFTGRGGNMYMEMIYKHLHRMGMVEIVAIFNQKNLLELKL